MNEIQVFTNDTFGEVRTITRDGEPWFVAADVCSALELTNNRMAVDRLDEDEKDVSSIDTLGGAQSVTIINEPGLYSLVLGSRKPEARAFKRWITHEVIPTIRKTGAYMTPETAMKIVSNPDFLIATANKIKQLQGDVAERDERITELESEKAQMTEELDIRKKQGVKYFILGSYYEQAIKTGTDITLTETAKEIGCERHELIDLCLRKKYLYRNQSGRLLPYANRTAKGVFTIKEYKYKGGYALEPTLYVTIAGRAKLNAECINAGLVRPTLPDADTPEWELAEAQA